MSNYIDGFVFPIPRIHMEEYRVVAIEVAGIWKEHGAIIYVEFVGDDLFLEGTRSFVDIVNAKENEVIIFGWVMFPSQVIRDSANSAVASDPRMTELVAPLTQSERLIFDASRMAYGGFKSLL